MFRDVLFNGNSFRSFTSTVAPIFLMTSCRGFSSSTTTSCISCHRRKNCRATKSYNKMIPYVCVSVELPSIERPKVSNGQCRLSLTKGNILYIDITYIINYNNYRNILFHNIVNNTNKINRVITVVNTTKCFKAL